MRRHRLRGRKVILGLWGLVLVLVASAQVVLCRPPVPRTVAGGPRADVSMAVDFLTKYGYLRSSELGAGSLRTEDQLREAIRTMQRFGHIPQTGVVDERTMRLMRRRRCGVPDLIGTAERVRRYALQGQKWPSTNLTWSIQGPVGRAEREMVRSQLARAFQVWSEASVLTFREVDAARADILVSFLHGPHGDGYPFDGEGAVLAHAFFPGEGIGGDAHFDAEERWIPQQPAAEEDGVNLFAVAAHEIGHSLGLSHSSTPGSLMFPYYQIVDGHFQLPDDDANGIQQLYGAREDRKWAAMPTAYTMAVPSSSSKPPSSTVATIPTTTRQRHKTTASMTRSFEKSSSTTVATAVPSSTATREWSTEAATQAPRRVLGEPPDRCNTSIDAISVIRREVFLFKGKYFWRLDRKKTLKRGYPAPTDRFWNDIPPDIDRIDALYERPTDTKIVFFSGRRYWLFAANELVPGYPRPLRQLGLPAYVDHIDAAMVWGHNGKTYLFSGRQYWKFDEIDGKVELDYPRDISAWRGVPANIDAAFQWTDGNTYFFKGKKFWQFNDIKMKARSTPGDLSEFWFGCKVHHEEETTTTPAASSTTTTSLLLDSSRAEATSLGLVAAILPILHCLILVQ